MVCRPATTIVWLVSRISCRDGFPQNPAAFVVPRPSAYGLVQLT